MNRQQRTLWLLLAIVCSAGATVLLLSTMVTSPGNNLVDLYGDCGKNYFTFIYHSVYDHGLWFQGMNYPYGEHIIYADGQPIFSTFLNYFIHPDAHGALAAMNLLIAFSFFLAIIFIYKILLRFSVKPLAAIVFACLIILLCPQVLRVRGHFAMAFPSLIPMIFYFSILYDDTRKVKWLIWIFVTGYIMSFVHLYLGAIVFLWLAFYVLGIFLFTKGDTRQRMRYAAPVFLLLFFLFVSIKGSVYITDPITDRPSTPWGSLEYITHVKDLAASQISPFWQYLLNKKYVAKLPELSEGYGYLGITTIAIILLAVLMALIKKIKKQPQSPMPAGENFSNIWFFIGAGSLLMAMGIPFIWHLQWLMNYVSLFRQFRSLGRFNWAFYYIISIYAAILIYRWYAAIVLAGRRAVAYVFLLACLLIWGWEANGYITYTAAYMKNGKAANDQFFHNNEKTWPQYLADKNYKADSFQGIILLPFFACGSEKFWVGDDLSAFPEGMAASVQMRLPIVDIMMSRTSWSETAKQLKTIGGPYTDKPMLRDAAGSKPFLIIKAESDISPDEAYLLQASDYIGNDFKADIYACYPGRIIANDKKYADSAIAVLPYMHSTDTCIVNTGSWYVNHFDVNATIPRMFGTGAAAAITGGNKIIDTIAVKPGKPGQLYEFSCWFLVTGKDYSTPYITLKLMDSTGNVIKNTDALTKRTLDSHGLWFRDFLYFNIPASCKAIAINLENPDKECYSVMDEMLLRPADAVIISKGADGKVMVNNHILNTGNPGK